jgi:hypothetical protein
MRHAINLFFSDSRQIAGKAVSDTQFTLLHK